MADTSEKCENCGREIGRLETPYVFSEHIVCFDCDQRLRRQAVGNAGTVPAEVDVGDGAKRCETRQPTSAAVPIQNAEIAAPFGSSKCEDCGGYFRSGFGFKMNGRLLCENCHLRRRALLPGGESLFWRIMYGILAAILGWSLAGLLFH